MPCYLFTYHGYGTWMPDHAEGFVRRNKGPLQSDAQLGRIYRAQQHEATSIFDDTIQQLLIEETLDTTMRLELRAHYIATETTHLHALLSWHGPAHCKKVRISLKSSLSRRINREIAQRTWLSEGGSMRRVLDDTHFRHLVETYLPKHRGRCWCPQSGLISPRV